MKISTANWGKLSDGTAVNLYTMENDNGVKAVISDLGGDIVNLFVPDKNGNMGDIVLGYNDFETYKKNPNFFGAIVGRNANRVSNAEVEIAGKVYNLDKNDDEHNLHSGSGNLTFKVFNAKLSEENGDGILTLEYTQKDMADGFPGNLDVKITYTLTKDNALVIDYYAVSDKDTMINMTNHSYFNLAGHASGNIDEQIVEMNAEFYTPNNDACIPTGEILSVEGTPFDFRNGRAFGQDINSKDGQIGMFGGYDHNFVLTGYGYRKAATAVDPASGRTMEAWTDQPGMQIYTSNGMDLAGKDGAAYKNHQGFCMETQTFPGADKMRWLASPYYKAGQEYKTRTAFKFYSKK